jgi:hypothetical protein
MPAPSSTVTIRPPHPLSPNCLHMPTAGSTAEVVAGTVVNGLVVNSANSALGWNLGPTATISTPIYQGPISFTATAQDRAANAREH